ncbi:MULTISPECIES: phosphodiesterase [Rhodomicrobium]|uniref:phosphodiesterase n=1 Tax=Rhodomicrobium TaxID=1068 RepID=UPI000B4A9218|nr:MULTISPECIES: phosphodiesterase [Rhodomicrobium]
MYIAQLTDTHIRPKGHVAYGLVDTAAFLARAVDFIARSALPIDAVIVTGDLTDFGTAEEYAHFLELIAPLAVPVLPLPGNHDERAAMALALAHMAPFGQTQGDDLSYAADLGPLRLIMLDATVPGAPHGAVLPVHLAWLEGVLASAPDRPALLALHHPPFLTGIRHMDVQNCQGASELEALLMRWPNVLAVVCGHVHRSVHTSLAGRGASIAPSPAHAVTLDLAPHAPPSFHLEPPGFHLHCWQATEGGPHGRLVTHLVPIGAFPGPHPFFDASGRPVE